jgi:hypothetical protein
VPPALRALRRAGVSRDTFSGFLMPTGVYIRVPGRRRPAMSADERRIQNNLASARYRAADPERARENVRRSKLRPECILGSRNAYLLRTFGITQEQYDSMLLEQGGHCKLCPCADPSYGTIKVVKYFHVDHDRSCCPGQRSCGLCIRGLLCRPCNVGLGGIFERVARYDFDASFCGRCPRW